MNTQGKDEYLVMVTLQDVITIRADGWERIVNDDLLEFWLGDLEDREVVAAFNLDAILGFRLVSDGKR